MTSVTPDIMLCCACWGRDVTAEEDVYGASNALTEWQPPLWQRVEPTVENPKDEFDLWAKLAKRGTKAWLKENPF